MKRVKFILALCLFSVAMFFLIGSKAGITGAFIGVVYQGSLSGIGIIMALAAGIIFATELEKRAHLTSAIKKDKGLMRLVEESTGSGSTIQRELDHLTNELSKDHIPGRSRHIDGTDIFYIGGRNGARVYYRKTPGGYQIVGKSAKGANQDKVISKLAELYKK